MLSSRADSQCTHFYFLLEGEVSLQRGGVTLGTLGEGSFVVGASLTRLFVCTCLELLLSAARPALAPASSLQQACICIACLRMPLALICATPRDVSVHMHTPRVRQHCLVTSRRLMMTAAAPSSQQQCRWSALPHACCACT